MTGARRGLRVLLTRPHADSEAFATLLHAHGHEAVIAPLLTIHPIEDAQASLDLAGVQAILFTSANGVRAFAAATPRRDLRVLTVGPGSAAAARAAGFGAVESADGDVHDLAGLARARLRPADGALLQAAGTVTAGDLAGDLTTAGFDVRRVRLYDAHTAERIPDTLRAALLSGSLDAAAFFSPRTGATFVKLVREARVQRACARLTAVCLSDAVAARVRGIQWADVRVAVRPDAESLLWRLNQIQSAGQPALTETGMADNNANDQAARPSDKREPEASDGASRDDDGSESQAEGPAQRVIGQFGGIRPMASKLGVAVSTVQGWRERGTIPAARHGQIVAAAEQHDVTIDRDDLAASAAAGDAGGAPKPAASRIPSSARREEAAASSAAPHQGEAHRAAEPPDASANGAATATPQAGRERRGFGAGALLGAFVLGAVVLGLGAAAAVVTREAWLPLTGPATTSGVSEEQLAALEEQFAAREEQFAALDERLSSRAVEIEQAAQGTAREAAARLEGGFDAVTERLDALEERAARQSAEADSRLEALPALQERSDRTSRDVQDLSNQVSTLSTAVQDLRQTTDDLQSRLAEAVAARQEARAAASDRTAVALAVLQLRDALRTGDPFPNELAAVREVTAEAPEPMRPALGEATESLSPYAENGVPGIVGLTAAFPETARKIAAAGSGGDEGDWVADMKRRVTGLVAVRPTGPVEGDGTSAIVARAEAHLDAGNLNAAVSELEKLKGAAAEAAKPWLEKARARLAANEALGTLARAVAGGSGAGGDTSAGTSEAGG